MRKNLFLILLIFIFSITSAFSYAIKVYDQYGNRVGTYRKEGDKFVLYDFNDKKVENAQELIKNAPSQKYLTDLTQYFYDENMNPIGSYTTGLWGNYGRFYPRGRFIPKYFYNHNEPYIIRPSAKNEDYLKIEPYPYKNNSRNNTVKIGF